MSLGDRSCVSRIVLQEKVAGFTHRVKTAWPFLVVSGLVCEKPLVQIGWVISFYLKHTLWLDLETAPSPCRVFNSSYQDLCSHSIMQFNSNFVNSLHLFNFTRLYLLYVINYIYRKTVSIWEKRELELPMQLRLFSMTLYLCVYILYVDHALVAGVMKEWVVEWKQKQRAIS